MTGFLWVVTHSKVFKEPTPLEEALAFIEDFRLRRAVRIARPGSDHWAIFTDLLSRYEAKGNLIPGAFRAALAVEWISLDRGFADTHL